MTKVIQLFVTCVCWLALWAAPATSAPLEMNVSLVPWHSFNDLILYMKFNEASGVTTFVDSAPYSISSTARAAGFNAAGATLFNNAICNSGTGDLNMGTNVKLTNWNVSESLTFMMWFQTSSFSTTQQHIYSGSNSVLSALAVGATVGLQPGPINGVYGMYPMIQFGSTASTAATTFTVYGTTPVNDNVWHHAAFVVDRTSSASVKTVMIYIDGMPQQLATAAGTCGIVNSTGTMVTISQCPTASPAYSTANYFGARVTAGAANVFIGCLDEFTIWKIPIRYNDIAYIYTQQSNSILTSQACSAVAQGDYATCYKYRLQCHYVAATGLCASPAPTTCSQFLTDIVGCTGNTSCVVNGATGQCANNPQTCSLVLSQTVCGQYSNCRWVGSACIAASTTCSAITGPTASIACGAAGCYWDVYLGQCFDSLTEVVAENACASWSAYPIPNTACAAHGCTLLSDGLTCTTPGVGAGNVTAMVTNWPVMFVNPIMSTTNATFYVQVWLPNNELFNNPPVWYYITLGNQFPGYSMAQDLVPNSGCNDIGAFNSTSGPPLYVAISNGAALTTYFNNWVNTGHNYTFPTNDLYGPTMYSLVGNLSIASNNPTTIVSSVSFDSTNQWLIFQLSFDINRANAYCNKLGVSVFTTATNLLYTIPISVIRRTNLNTYSEQGLVFYVNTGLTGQVLALSASSRYQPLGVQQEISIVTSSCPAGQARMNIIYMIEYQNVFSPSIWVGPLTANDVNFTTPAPPIYSSLNNCYQEQVLSVLPLYTVNSVSYTQLITQTSCRPLTSDGLTFNNCSYGLPSNIAADLGSSTANYATRLNGLHDFYVNAYSCPLSALASLNYSQCVLAVVSTANYPDYFPSTINVVAYPSTTLSVSFDVFAGLLPTPFTTDLTQIELLSQGPNVLITKQDLNNANLFWNGQLTFVIGMASANIQTFSNLTFDTATLFSIVGLDPFGVPIQGLPTLHISDIFPYMTYVPKSLLSLCTSSSCTNTPATANQRAYDSFSIPVLTLRGLLPANGYAISAAYVYTLQTGAAALQAQGLSFRRLLSVADGDEKEKSVTKRGMVRGNVHLKSASSTTPAPTSAPFVNGNNGLYDLGIYVSDVNNPSPPQTYQIGNTTYANVSNHLVRGVQCGVKFCVSPQSLAYSPFANQTYAIQTAMTRVPIVVSKVLGIDSRQVLFTTAFTDAPNNSILALAVPCTYINLESAHRRHTGFHSMSTEVVQFNTFYITFVIIAAPNASASAQDLVANLTSQQSQQLLAYYMSLNGVVLTLQPVIDQVNVIVEAPSWYVNLTTQINIYFQHEARSTSTVALAVGWIIGLVVFLSIAILACMACGIVYDPLAGSDSRKRRRKKEKTEDEQETDSLTQPAADVPVGFVADSAASNRAAAYNKVFW